MAAAPVGRAPSGRITVTLVFRVRERLVTAEPRPGYGTSEGSCIVSRVYDLDVFSRPMILLFTIVNYTNSVFSLAKCTDC